MQCFRQILNTSENILFISEILYAQNVIVWLDLANTFQRSVVRLAMLYDTECWFFYFIFLRRGKWFQHMTCTLC